MQHHNDIISAVGERTMPREPLLKNPRRRSIWIDESLWARMKKKARKDQRTMSSWIRVRLEEATRQ